MKICIIAGNNPDYVFSLVQALAHLDVHIELIGADDYEPFAYARSVTFLNLRGSQDHRAFVLTKITRMAKFYLGCLSHLWKSDAQLVHVQEFRFEFVEGIILVLIYRLLGKRVVYTAHNVQKKGKNNRLNHLIFRRIYRNIDHIICHTENIKNNIITRFSICDDKISVIQRGLNCSVPITPISRLEARKKIGIAPFTKALLMFGRIRPDKGYDIALQALKCMRASSEPVVLLIVGGVAKKDKQDYLNDLKEYVVKEGLEHIVQFYDYYIPDRDVEIFFKAADALLLPYKDGDFQSGVLFLAYRFGLPIIASDVGSLTDEIEPGIRGYIFESQNPHALAAKIEQFYRDLQPRRDVCQHIIQHGEKYSWNSTASATLAVYRRLLQDRG